MWSVQGQPNDWNFFSNNFTNHIPGVPSSETALYALAKKFSSATDYVQQCGLSDFSQFDQAGTKVNPVIPFSLRFEPHSDVHTLFPKDLGQNDFMHYVEQLKTVPSGSNLYNIYGMDKPKELGGKEILIGTLVLDGKLTSSKWGDENLFFRHQKMNDDIKFHPEWTPYLPTFSSGGKCPFMGY